MAYSKMTKIWNAAMEKPTLDLALRHAETQTYDLLRDMGFSMYVASAACDEVLKDIARYYQRPTVGELVTKSGLSVEGV